MYWNIWHLTVEPTGVEDAGLSTLSCCPFCTVKSAFVTDLVKFCSSLIKFLGFGYLMNRFIKEGIDSLTASWLNYLISMIELFIDSMIRRLSNLSELHYSIERHWQIHELAHWSIDWSIHGSSDILSAHWLIYLIRLIPGCTETLFVHKSIDRL